MQKEVGNQLMWFEKGGGDIVQREVINHPLIHAPHFSGFLRQQYQRIDDHQVFYHGGQHFKAPGSDLLIAQE